jgi:hypothetical protein
MFSICHLPVAPRRSRDADDIIADLDQALATATS